MGLANGACCEVQLLTEPLFDFKKCLHQDYGMTRIVNSPGGSEFTGAIKRWTESVDNRQRTNRLRRMSPNMADSVALFSPGHASQQVSYGTKKHPTTKRLSQERLSTVMRMFKGESSSAAATTA